MFQHDHELFILATEKLVALLCENLLNYNA